MASYFTYFMDPLPPQLWGLWPRIQGCLMEWGIDYWDNILPPLDNLVSRDTATFLGSTNPNYQESVFQVGAAGGVQVWAGLSVCIVCVGGWLWGDGGSASREPCAAAGELALAGRLLAPGCTPGRSTPRIPIPKAPASPFQSSTPCAPPPAPQMVSHSLGGDFSDIEVVAAPKLMEVVLAHCPSPAADRWVEPYVSLAWARLQRATRRPLKDQLVVLISVALHYNAGLTLAALHRLGAAGPFMAGWSDMIAARRPSGRKPAHFRQQRLKKLASLGLVALLRAPDDALGPLAGGLPAVLRGALTLLNDLHAQQVEAAEALEAGTGSEEEVGGGGGGPGAA